jgi:hypothetical protein
VLLGFVRIYHGAGHPFMVVWKGEFSYQDTLVNLGKYLDMTREDLIAQHPYVLGQLEEMYLIMPQDGLSREEIQTIRKRRWREGQPPTTLKSAAAKKSTIKDGDLGGESKPSGQSTEELPTHINIR